MMQSTAAADLAPAATAHAETQEPTIRAPHGAALAELALAMGGFAIGTCEFASMGLLPSVAHSVGISIPEGGHVISAYALGVVVGAPLITVLFAKAPRRAMLIGLMVRLRPGQFDHRPGAHLSSAARQPASSPACRTGPISASPPWWPQSSRARADGLRRSAGSCWASASPM